MSPRTIPYRSLHTVAQVRPSTFWETLFLHVLSSDETAWDAVRSRGFVAVASRPRSSLVATRRGVAGDFQAPGDNYIFHNFAHRGEAVRAYDATGQVTITGLGSGMLILDDESGFAQVTAT